MVPFHKGNFLRPLVDSGLVFQVSCSGGLAHGRVTWITFPRGVHCHTCLVCNFVHGLRQATKLEDWLIFQGENDTIGERRTHMREKEDSEKEKCVRLLGAIRILAI